VTGVWRLLIDQRARKHLERLDPVIQRRIAKAIDALTTDPEPAGCKSLRGMTDVLRVRVGDYRILYQLARADHVVQVIDIDHRRDIYR
jgi:mRNA interferase RelE/StbE